MSKATEIPVVRIQSARATTRADRVAVERPLEINARLGGELRRVSLTMRTPGDDPALAAGFLFAERVISDARAVRRVEILHDDAVVVDIEAEFCGEALAALGTVERRFVTTGACGVCGRASIEDMAPHGPAHASDAATPPIDAATVHELPARLRAAQQVFAETGGLHAAGLFSAEGTLHQLFEDVGRHNAVDKLVGSLLMAGRLPASAGILVVSGRASFELVQKAAVAGIPAMVAVGAPSSLAVEIAAQAGMTLIGFARERSFNLYCGAARIIGLEPTGLAAGNNSSARNSAS